MEVLIKYWYSLSKSQLPFLFFHLHHILEILESFISSNIRNERVNLWLTALTLFNFYKIIKLSFLNIKDEEKYVSHGKNYRAGVTLQSSRFRKTYMNYGKILKLLKHSPLKKFKFLFLIVVNLFLSKSSSKMPERGQFTYFAWVFFTISHIRLTCIK